MVSSVNSNAISSWAESLFYKLDTKNQGYIDKSDLQSAFSKIAESIGSSDSTDVDEVFRQMDSDSNGKVTKAELFNAMTKVANELDSQFNQSRLTISTSSLTITNSSLTTGSMPPPSSAAADANGDSIAGSEETVAYEKMLGGDDSSTSITDLNSLLNSITSALIQGAEPGDSAGFTKDELTSQLDVIGSADSKRTQSISNVVDNFEAADINDDGKVSREEARAYDQSNVDSGSREPSPINSTSMNDRVQIKTMQQLKIYSVQVDTDAPIASNQIIVSA